MRRKPLKKLEKGFIPHYTVHGDHNQITAVKVEQYVTLDENGKKAALREVLDRQNRLLDEGALSIALDLSTLTLLKEKDVKERLKHVINTCAEALGALYKKCAELGIEISIEGEVGDIGKEISTVEEAVTYYAELAERLKDISEEEQILDLIALQLGTSHGYDFDDNDRVIPYTGVTIDLKRAREVVDAFWKMGLNIRVALHGFSGTPVEFVPDFLDKGIGKVNINTDWQAIEWKVLEAWYPALYKKLFNESYPAAVAAKIKAKDNLAKANAEVDAARIARDKARTDTAELNLPEEDNGIKAANEAFKKAEEKQKKAKSAYDKLAKFITAEDPTKNAAFLKARVHDFKTAKKQDYLWLRKDSI